MLAPLDKTLARDLAYWQRMRTLGVVCGVLAAVLVATARVMAGRDGQESAALVVVVVAAVALATSVAITLWAQGQSRKLLVRQVADLQEATNIRAAAAGSAVRVETTEAGPLPDLRFADPKSRKAYTRRKWLLFAAALVLGSAAEYWFRERGDVVYGAVYGVFALIALVYALVLRQRLLLAR